MGFNHRDRRKLDRIEKLVWRIYRKLNPETPDGVQINQIIKGESMSITGTNVGGSSTFEADALLSGVADAAGFPAGSVDTWTVDDPSIVVGPDSGPDVNEAGALDQVVISLPAAYAKPDYGLTVSVQLPTPAGGTAPAPLVFTTRVPAIPAPPPVPDGVLINQVK